MGVDQATELRRLSEVLAVELPAGYASKLCERHDQVLDCTFRSVVVYPEGLDVDKYRLGMPGGYAHVKVNDDGTYQVGVCAERVGWNLQSGGAVIQFPDAGQAVKSGLAALHSELRRSA